jgi:hypothetical protein
MDFSGERGHVVTDPNEALSIAFEEAYNWRVGALEVCFGLGCVKSFFFVFFLHRVKTGYGSPGVLLFSEGFFHLFFLSNRKYV